MYYTKYRPQKFSEISKPNEVAEALSTQVKGNKVSHAYLFIGPRGTGKTTTARILAKALNCSHIDPKTGDPCDTCDTCESIKIGSFMDLIEIDAASNRGIDDIRDLKDKIKLAPAHGAKKVYIIDEVHMLTTEAFNALLKTLEEPPEHAVFILCTTEAHKVPDTIKSRCQVFKFKRATVAQITTKLQGILENEGFKGKLEKKDLEKIAKASLGGFRDAETLLQQVLEGELDVESFVGTTTKDTFVDFTDSLISKDTNSALRQLNNLYENGTELSTWNSEFLKFLRDLLFIISDAHEGIVDVSEELFSRMEEQASKLSPKEIVRMIEAFSIAQTLIKGAVLPQLPLEIAVIKVVGAGGNVGDSDGSRSKNSPKNDSGGSGDFADVAEEIGGAIDTAFAQIESAWADVLKGVVKHNHGVSALLRSARPKSLADGKLLLEVFYKFHKERLETARNKEILETVLEEIFGEKIRVECYLSDEKPKKERELSDLNIEVPSPADATLGEKLVHVFDGGLPL